MKALVRRLHSVVAGMLIVLDGVMSDRLMMRLRRRLSLSKGHHRAVRQAHEAEQHGDDDPEGRAEGPERSHTLHLGSSLACRQLTFGNPGLILTLCLERDKSAPMMTFAHMLFYRRRATLAPARDRM